MSRLRLSADLSRYHLFSDPSERFLRRRGTTTNTPTIYSCIHNRFRNLLSLSLKWRPNTLSEPLHRPRPNATPSILRQSWVDLPQQILVLQPFLHPFNSLPTSRSTARRPPLSSMSSRKPPSLLQQSSLRRSLKRTFHPKGGEHPTAPLRDGGVKLTSVLFFRERSAYTG